MPKSILNRHEIDAMLDVSLEYTPVQHFFSFVTAPRTMVLCLVGRFDSGRNFSMFFWKFRYDGQYLLEVDMSKPSVKQAKDQSEYSTPESLASLAEFEKWDAANGYQRTRTTVEDLRKKVEAIKLKRISEKQQ